MRFITAMLVSANLALGMQGLSIESTCEELIKASPLNADLASTIKWKLEGCLVNQACMSAAADFKLAKICSSPLNIQENRIQNVKPVPHKTDDADAFWGQFQNHRVELRPYKGVVLEKYSCSLLQDFVCGLGFDGDYCGLMHAQKAGCQNFNQYNGSPNHSSTCKEISEKDYENTLEREHFVMQCVGASAQPVVSWS